MIRLGMACSPFKDEVVLLIGRRKGEDGVTGWDTDEYSLATILRGEDSAICLLHHAQTDHDGEGTLRRVDSDRIRGDFTAKLYGTTKLRLERFMQRRRQRNVLPLISCPGCLFAHGSCRAWERPIIRTKQRMRMRKSAM